MTGQMKCEEVKNMLSEYVDGSLSADEQSIVQSHVDECPECKKLLEFFRGLPAEIAGLPKSILPTRDLWPEISGRISESQIPPIRYSRLTLAQRRNGQQPDRNSIASGSSNRFPKSGWKTKALVVFSIVVFAAAGIWFTIQSSTSGWNVARLQGILKIGSEVVVNSGKLRVGEWLETDNTSRAKIDVGLIGELEVEPNSRLRLIGVQTTDHRVELEKGTIHARIWAPPRLFFVETAEATVIDLGCEYTLSVDINGVGLLKVSAGYVALNRDGKESIVPAGAACKTRPGFGPGTPFRLSATPLFRSALEQFDRGNEESTALAAILTHARPEDAITLWHLLRRTSNADKQQVYNRLEALVRVPSDVTCDGILKDNAKMMERLGEEIGIVL